MKNDIQIESHNEKLHNIIGEIPPYLARGGILFMTFLLLVLFIAAWFIPYPKTVNIPFTISCDLDSKQMSIIANMPYSFIGNVEKKMTVSLEFEGYNSRIYGNVHGEIVSLDKTVVKQDENYFTVNILLTKSNENIEIKKGMKGEALILLPEKSVLVHILKNFLKKE